MATPAYRVDETKGLQLVNQGGAKREQTLYLFTPGDVIDPERRRQIATLRDGGEEVAARCLRRTPNYIPRCELTPLETWFEPLGIAELAGDSMKDLVSVGQTVQEELPPMVNPGQFFRRNEPMMGMPHYPGVDIGSVIDQVGYRGVKEIESLRGNEWDQGYVHEVQRAFFPNDWVKPIQLRLIEARIREVSGSLAPIGEELLASCEQFRLWAQERINQEHGLLATRISHQHTYRYSRLAPQLLAQLEISPKDSASDVTQLAQELVKAMTLAQSPAPAIDINAAIEAAVKAALLAHGVGVPVRPAEPQIFKCSFCDQEFDTAQGKSMHETRWCQNKPEVKE